MYVAVDGKPSNMSQFMGQKFHIPSYVKNIIHQFGQPYVPVACIKHGSWCRKKQAVPKEVTQLFSVVTCRFLRPPGSSNALSFVRITIYGQSKQPSASTFNF